jgi:hypothetical protein
MSLRSNNEIHIQALTKTHSKANCQWNETHLSKSLMVTIQGDMPLDLKQGLALASDLQTKIREAIWRHYVEYAQAIKPKE